MLRRSFEYIFVVMLLIAVGCAPSVSKPGTGGKNSATKIEQTGHQPIPEGVSCYVCHKNDVPEQEFHKNFGNNCEKCHGKQIWMAYKYPHPAWELNGIHKKTRCTRCHTKAGEYDFNFYQCYGCHHEKKATEKLHADLNIDTISDCIACHKTALQE